MTEAAERPEALQAWTALSALVDTVRTAVNRDLQREAGLTLAENLVLCRVAMAPQRRLRMVEIAQLLGLAKSAITKTVDRLEARGLLARERDPGDRRTVYARLTEHGQRTFTAAQSAYIASISRHFTRTLDPADIRALSQMASRAPAPRYASGQRETARLAEADAADQRTQEC